MITHKQASAIMLVDNGIVIIIELLFYFVDDLLNFPVVDFGHLCHCGHADMLLIEFPKPNHIPLGPVEFDCHRLKVDAVK